MMGEKDILLKRSNRYSLKFSIATICLYQMKIAEELKSMINIYKI